MKSWQEEDCSFSWGKWEHVPKRRLVSSLTKMGWPLSTNIYTKLLYPNAYFLLVQFWTRWATPDGLTFQIFAGRGMFVKHNDIRWNLPRQKSSLSINSMYLVIIKPICIEISYHRLWTTLIHHLYVYLILDHVVLNAHTGVFWFKCNQWWWPSQVWSISPWPHWQSVTSSLPLHHSCLSHHQKALYSASDFMPSPTTFYCGWPEHKNINWISHMKCNPSVLKKSWLLPLWVTWC